MRNASLNWDIKERCPSLENISLEVKLHKFVAIVGKVGSGKTSLLMSFLGNLFFLLGDKKKTNIFR
jgi:ABC-type bacteriocin/lantibiotic exporter with double-glycine peptidase domain